MKRSLLTFTFALILSSSFSLLLHAPQAQAGMLDRIKGIYEAPDQLDEMREQYNEMQSAYEEQQRQTMEALENTRIEAERLAVEQQRWQAENERVRQENAALEAQNQLLQERVALLEQQEASRQSWIDRVLRVTITVLCLLVGYFISVRIFRYIIWRSGRKNGTPV